MVTNPHLDIMIKTVTQPHLDMVTIPHLDIMIKTLKMSHPDTLPDIALNMGMKVVHSVNQYSFLYQF